MESTHLSTALSTEVFNGLTHGHHPVRRYAIELPGVLVPMHNQRPVLMCIVSIHSPGSWGVTKPRRLTESAGRLRCSHAPTPWLSSWPRSKLGVFHPTTTTSSAAAPLWTG